jgi:hypothetical protein
VAQRLQSRCPSPRRSRPRFRGPSTEAATQEE